jgi:hypothetical protein
MEALDMRIPTILFATGAALALAACQGIAGPRYEGRIATPTTATTVPSSWSVPGESLHERVHDALMEQMGPAVNDVGVRVDGSAVFLTGRVHSDADKQRAHAIAHGVEGATSVDISGLSVQP